MKGGGIASHLMKDSDGCISTKNPSCLYISRKTIVRNKQYHYLCNEVAYFYDIVSN